MVDGLEIRWRIPWTGDWMGEPSYELVHVPRAGEKLKGGFSVGVYPFDPSAPPSIPKSFETTIIDRAKGRGYKFSFEADDDGPAIVGFAMDTMEGFDAIRSATEFGKIPFLRLVDESLAAVASEVDLSEANHLGGHPGGVRWRSGTLTRRDIEAARRPKGGRGAKITRERLEQVADMHRAATEAGDATSKYIARELKVTPENARRLIMMARKAGLIAPAGES